MKIETKCLHAGYEPKNGEPRMIPIIQSATFKYDSSEEELAAAGVPSDLVRLSVGLENVDDLISDISSALEAV